VIGGGKLNLEERPGEGDGADDLAGAVCAWLFAFERTSNTGDGAVFPNRLVGATVGGALIALGGTVDKLGAGVAGVVAGFAPNERRGGVRGLCGGNLPPDGLLDSSASGLSGEGGGIGKTAKRGLGDAGT
jgi:hypothetical protein